MATNATVEKQPLVEGELRSGEQTAILRYSGFDQRDNIRSYVFQYIAPGAKARPIVVNGKLALFIEHDVHIQDGPVLCLHALISQIRGFDFSQTGTLHWLLTAEDLLAYIASQPSTAEVKVRRERQAGFRCTIGF